MHLFMCLLYVYQCLDLFRKCYVGHILSVMFVSGHVSLPFCVGSRYMFIFSFGLSEVAKLLAHSWSLRFVFFSTPYVSFLLSAMPSSQQPLRIKPPEPGGKRQKRQEEKAHGTAMTPNASSQVVADAELAAQLQQEEQHEAGDSALPSRKDSIPTER